MNISNSKENFEKEKKLMEKQHNQLLFDFIELKAKHFQHVSEAETSRIKYKMRIKKLTMLKEEYESYIKSFNEAQKNHNSKNSKRFSLFN